MRKTSIIIPGLVVLLSVGACESDGITGATDPGAADLSPGAPVPSAQGSTSITNPADDEARRRCRWVWRHGLVCETKLSTVVL